MFDILATNCNGLKILNLVSMKGVLKLGKEIKPFAFRQLLELNVSGTLIDDKFIYLLSQSCKALCALNISCCPYVTDAGLTKVSFNLTLLNVAHCHFQIQTITHVLREFDAQVLCMQGIRTSEEERIRRASTLPLYLEIGIPSICGFFLPDYQDFPLITRIFPQTRASGVKSIRVVHFFHLMLIQIAICIKYIWNC